MNSSFQDSKNRLREGLFDLLWQQWTALGVAGHGRSGDRRVIDPEALLLATTRFGRNDPRLLDEAIDWLASNGRRINLHRLRRLHHLWPLGDSRVLGAVGELLAGRSVLRKWERVVKERPTDGHMEPLFIGQARASHSDFPSPDPYFHNHGLLRDPMLLRGMSRPPDPHHPGNFLCTLRALFGVNARAEIMAWLLTHEFGHPAAIARDTSYFVKSVQLTLNEMADSGQLRSERRGREKMFWIRREDWSFLTPGAGKESPPTWVDWMPLFQAIAILLDQGDVPLPDNVSERLQSVTLREGLDAAMPALAKAGFSKSLIADRTLTGSIFIEALARDLDTLQCFLSNDSDFSNQ